MSCDQHRATLVAIKYLFTCGFRCVVLVGRDAGGFKTCGLTRRIKELAEFFGIATATADLVVVEGQYRIRVESEHLCSGPQSGEIDRAWLALDVDTAETALRALSDQSNETRRSIPMICIDSEGKSLSELSTVAIRLPLKRAGELAVDSLLQEISGFEPRQEVVGVEPELIVREPIHRHCGLNRSIE